MKHYKSIIRKYGVYISLLMAGGCGADGVMEIPVQETNTCHLIFDATIKGFDSSATTRAVDYDWPDNSNVYLMFVNGESRIDGKAVYNKTENLWTLYYNGMLPSGGTQLCYAY